MKQSCMLEKQDGSVLIVALIMLVLMTMMGISATRTTEVEIQIAGNDMTHKVNLYKAESASMVAIQQMEDTEELGTFSWVQQTIGSVTEDDIRDETFWTDANTQKLGTDVNTRYVVTSEGTIDTGESLDMTRARIHSFVVFGRSNIRNGVSVVRLGFRKAF